jgi:hypothetical protein
MCKGKENSFVGEYNGESYLTRIDANGIKVEDKLLNIKLKIEKVGVGAYKCTTTYSDQPNNLITLGFKDDDNTIVSETSVGRGIIYIYFEGNKLRQKVSTIDNNGDRAVRSSELKRVTHNDCSCHHGHHGNCGCKH